MPANQTDVAQHSGPDESGSFQNSQGPQQSGHDQDQPPVQRSISVDRALVAYCRHRQMRFLVEGHPEPSARIMMPEAFLPVVALHAELSAIDLLRPEAAPAAVRELSGFLDGERASESRRMLLGTQLRQDSMALFGVLATVPPLTGDGQGSLRAALFVHALHTVFGYATDRPVEVGGVFARYSGPAGQGLKGILEKLDTSTKEATWLPAPPH
jgi:hypothetical protein